MWAFLLRERRLFKWKRQYALTVSGARENQCRILGVTAKNQKTMVVTVVLMILAVGLKKKRIEVWSI